MNQENRARRLLPLLAILALAAGFRIAVTVEHYPHPLFTSLRLDEIFNDQWALAAVPGNLFPARVPISAPGYPWFLALLYALFGRDLLAVRIAQVLVGVGSVLLVQRLGQRLFGRTAGLVSALLLALYWPLIIFEQRLLLVTLYLFLNLAFLLFALRALRNHTIRDWAGAGFLSGLSLVVYPTSLLLSLFTAAWLLAPILKERRAKLPLRPLVYSLALIAVIAPVIIFSSLRTGEWYFLRSYGGFNLYLGNNPAADGTMDARLGGGWDRIEALPFKEAGLTAASDQDRFYLKKVMGFIRDEPAAFLKLQAKKIVLFFNRRELRATIDPEFHRGLFPALDLPLPGFALLLGLALAGALGLTRTRPDHQLLLLYLLAHALAVISTVVSSRYRVPFVGGLVLLSGAGAVKLAAAIAGIYGVGAGLARPDLGRGKPRPYIRSAKVFGVLRHQPAGLVATPLLFLLGIAFAYLPAGPRYSYAEEYSYLGLAYAQAGDLKKAEQEYREAIAADPRASLAMIELAWIELNRHHLPAALEWQEKAVSADPDGAYGHFDFGQCLWAAGRREQALQELRRAVECKPLWDDAILKLAELEFQAGLNSFALQRLQNLRVLRPDLAPKIDALIANPKPTSENHGPP